MAVTVKIDLGYEFEVKAKYDEVFAVLSDVPASVSHFPRVEKLTDLGFIIDTANPEEFSAHIRKSFDQFGRVIKAAKIEPE